jgi:hypothetical protein
MKKKKFDLNPEMIRLDDKTSPDQLEMTKLTLYVPRKFLMEFKSWCALKNIPMSTAVQKFFERQKTL